MDQSRIAELLQPFLVSPLSEVQLKDILTYIDLLLRWNSRVNLTSIREPEEIVTRHFGESLFAARHLPASAASVIDIGSGAGFPGIPIKIFSPETPLTLIESNHKKVTFLREVIRTLNLTGVTVFAGRAKDYAPSSPPNIVTLRAVEKFSAILPTALRLAGPGGYLSLLIGEDQARIARRYSPDITWSDSVIIPGSSKRILLIGKQNYNKVG